MSTCRSLADSHSVVRETGDNMNDLDKVATFTFPLTTCPSTKNAKVAYATFDDISPNWVLKSSA